MRKMQLLKDLLTGTCVRFTVLAVCLMILHLIIGSGGTAENLIRVSNFLLLLPCGACIAAASLLRKSALSPTLCRLLHFFITWMSGFLFLWLPSGRAGRAADHLVALVVLAAIYWFCYLIAQLTAARFHRSREKS